MALGWEERLFPRKECDEPAGMVETFSILIWGLMTLVGANVTVV